jgi:putative hemolysin
MHKLARSKFSIFLNIILILFLIGYFLMPFANIGFLAKVYSPFCKIIDRFQGELYLPPWCEDVLAPAFGANNANVNQNNNVNSNQNVNANNANINTNTNSDTGLANPAAVKCLNDGGKLENYNDENGEFTICIFPDKSICDEWAYFRNECQTGKCFKECKNIGSASEGWYDSCTNKLLKFENCSVANNQTDQQTKNIIVKNPVANAKLTSPFKVEGTARVFENQVNVRVKGKDGKVLIQEPVIVKSPEPGEWGDFSITLSYDFNLTKEGTVEVYSISAKDGSEENLVGIPVKF